MTRPDLPYPCFLRSGAPAADIRSPMRLAAVLSLLLVACGGTSSPAGPIQPVDGGSAPEIDGGSGATNDGSPGGSDGGPTPIPDASSSDDASADANPGDGTDGTPQRLACTG